MANQSTFYTVGNWTVKEGYEEVFVKEWEKFARWTSTTQSGAGRRYLVQDPGNPKHFVSFGSWHSLEDAKNWQALVEFRNFMGKAKTLCDGILPSDMKLVATSE